MVDVGGRKNRVMVNSALTKEKCVPHDLAIEHLVEWTYEAVETELEEVNARAIAQNPQQV